MPEQRNLNLTATTAKCGKNVEKSWLVIPDQFTTPRRNCLPPNSVNHNQLWYTRDLQRLDLISLVALCYAPGRALWENGDLLELGVP